MEEWLIKTKALNLSLFKLYKFVNNGQFCPNISIFSKLEGDSCSVKSKILFDKWNEEKYQSQLIFY